MKFLKMKYILLLLFAKQINAQLPLNDATWTLARQDQFTSTNLDTQWNTTFPWGAQYNNGSEVNNLSNLLLNHDAGWLCIKCEEITPYTYTDSDGKSRTINYKSGVISSSWTAKYGYFEISAKMPIGHGYWPAFWIYDASGNPCWYNEIDIVENCGGENNNADEMGFCAWGYLFSTPSSPPCPATRVMPSGLDYVLSEGPGAVVTGNTALEHKYAVFWEPEKFTYYYDDKPVKIVEDPVSTPNQAIHAIINFATEPLLNDQGITNPNGPTPGITASPAYFKVNYFNLWQLIPDCGTSVSFCSNFNPGTYVSKVKQSITLEGSGCSDNINTSSNINLWATDFILLDVGTTITDNSSGGFSVNITKCPQ